MQIITRFAPSPSGSLHIGGARTALFNFLFAKANKGIFKLRIENTDVKRESLESVSSIINSLNWLGIRPDDKIVYQRDNINKHIEIVNSMVNSDLAYKCYLTDEELEFFKKKNQKVRSKWRDIKDVNQQKNKSFVVRLKVPLNTKVTLNDKIQGNISIDSKEIDDYVILRSDGSPTFLLSSAVDDYKMNITHIIRGDDHLTNTFRQYYIFKFLYDKLPIFAHIPLIHNQHGKKMSKRDNASSILDYKNNGYLKEALNNYLLRLGWSSKDKEILTLEEAGKIFKLEDIGKSPAKIDKKKIDFLNSYYLKKKPKEDLLLILLKIIEEMNIKIGLNEKRALSNLLPLLVERSSTLNQLYSYSKFIFNPDKKFKTLEEKKIILESKKLKENIIKRLNNIKVWNKINIDNDLKEFVSEQNINFKAVGQPLRLIIAHSLNSPSISVIMEQIGKKEVIKRLKKLW